MIRPRLDSAWHDYARVFADLRSGYLSMAEYDIMVAEDALEADRRRAGLVVAVATLADLPNALAQADEDVKADMASYAGPQPVIRPKQMPLPPAPRLKVAITSDDDDESITHSIDLVDGEAVILIRNEPSGAI